MAMVFKENKLEIIVPNSEAAINAQHNGIANRTVGGYYMSEKLKECLIFLNGLNGNFYIDLPTTYFNSSLVIDKLEKFNLEDCFKDKLISQKAYLKTLHKYLIENDSFLYKIDTPTINEHNKYLKFNNTDIMFELFRTLTLGDLMKIVIEKVSNDCFIIYNCDMKNIESIYESGKYSEWME